MDEAEKIRRLVDERERLGLAEMITVGFHEPKKLSRFDISWQARAAARVPVQESVEDMSRRADDMWASHEAAMKKRPVS